MDCRSKAIGIKVKKMAKKSSGPNKSQAIRQYYESNPNAKPMEVAAALKEQGIEVTPAFVSTIRSTSKKKKPGRPGRPSKASKRGRKPGVTAKRAAKSTRSTSTRSTTSSTGGNVSIDSLIKVKQLVASVGGVDEARSALAALERLMK